MHKDNQNLSVNVCVKMTRNDATLVQEEAKRRGFETTGAFLRELLLGSLSVPTDRTLLLESAMRVEFLVAECFKVFAPDADDRAEVEGLQRKAELMSSDLLKGVMLRRRNGLGSEKESHGS